MKVAIELSDAEVAGIKSYLIELGEKPTTANIKAHIQGIVSGTINSPSEAVSYHIQQQLNG